jgi:hypothetical protein
MMKLNTMANAIQMQDQIIDSLNPTVWEFLWNTPRSSKRTARIKTTNPIQTAKEVS